jgi:CHAT domain-containing protein
LSICESGFGSYDISEGILGLKRAFVYAGANNLIFSLWKVYDKVSADLMINFYEKVMEGKPYSTALREAKLALINNPQTAAPHLWSSFLLIGR